MHNPFYVTPFMFCLSVRVSAHPLIVQLRDLQLQVVWLQGSSGSVQLSFSSVSTLPSASLLPLLFRLFWSAFMQMYLP